MDGEARFMGVRKMERTRGWTRIRGGIRRRKRKKEQFLVGKKELT
jgi:hypothetical protein